VYWILFLLNVVDNHAILMAPRFRNPILLPPILVSAAVPSIVGHGRVGYIYICRVHGGLFNRDAYRHYTLYLISHWAHLPSDVPSQPSPPVAPRTKNKDNPRALRGLSSRDSHGDWIFPSLCSWFMASWSSGYTKEWKVVNSWRIDFSPAFLNGVNFCP